MTKSRFLPILVTLLLLGGLAAETLSRPKPADAEPFHQRVKQAVAEVPSIIGDWHGTDIDLPPAAGKLLNDPIHLHRQFVNVRTGRVVNFLVVHCRDARDMAGHYPPNCYPSHGWTRVARDEAAAWEVDGQMIPGMEYEFTRLETQYSSSKIVRSLMILPDGRYVREIGEIRKAAADYLRQFYGAAQVQVVMDADLPAETRDEIFRELVAPNLPLLHVLSSGGLK